MPGINTQGGAQGWSQIHENLLNQQGTVKQRMTSEGQTELYVSNKFSNPFKNKAAHTAKLGGGMAAIKQALTNEYGDKFANMAFEKLSASRSFASLRGPMTSLSQQDLQRLDRMTRAADSFAASEFNTENTNFLKGVTGLNGAPAGGAAAAFTQLYENFVGDAAPQQINIKSATRAALEQLFVQTRDGASEDQITQMKHLMDLAAKEIRGMIGQDRMSRLESSADWRRA